MDNSRFRKVGQVVYEEVSGPAPMYRVSEFILRCKDVFCVAKQREPPQSKHPTWEDWQAFKDLAIECKLFEREKLEDMIRSPKDEPGLGMIQKCVLNTLRNVATAQRTMNSREFYENSISVARRETMQREERERWYALDRAQQQKEDKQQRRQRM